MLPYSKSLKSNSQKLRRTQTDAERRLWSRLNHDQLGFRFCRQKPILNYIVDFYCAKAKLVIELDGGQHYESEHQARDKMRDDTLSSLNLTVMRFSNYQVMTELDNVVETIWQYLQSVKS